LQAVAQTALRTGAIDVIAETDKPIAQISMEDLRALMAKSSYCVDNIPDLLERSGAPSTSFSSSDDYVDSGVVWTLLSSIGQQVGDELLGLSTHPVAPGSTELMVARAMQEPTLGEAISAFAAAANILWPDVHSEVKYRLGEMHYCMTFKSGSLDARQIFLELACIPFYCTFQWLADTKFPVIRFRTANCRPSGVIHHLAAPGCGVQFGGKGVDIVLPRSVAGLATAKRSLADWRSGIYQIFLNMLERRRTGLSTSRLQSYVANALRSGITSQDAIAASAGISVATLRRNLALERTSFRELRNHVFRESVSSLLAFGEPVEVIAAQTGYADPRSFRRTFQRVFGVNPSTFRKNMFAA
jgi:AraC-like DNA-binding protein